jgi:hypothetical protein
VVERIRRAPGTFPRQGERTHERVAMAVRGHALSPRDSIEKAATPYPHAGGAWCSGSPRKPHRQPHALVLARAGSRHLRPLLPRHRRQGTRPPPGAGGRARCSSGCAGRSAFLEGFSLHAHTHLHANDKQKLERLCRYGARGALALERMSRAEDGRIAYRISGRPEQACPSRLRGLSSGPALCPAGTPQRPSSAPLLQPSPSTPPLSCLYAYAHTCQRRVRPSVEVDEDHVRLNGRAAKPPL